MKIIGLCGGSGSGKGTVSSLFNRFGVIAIDTDRVYHEITSHPSECLISLAREFGSEIVKNGALDRAKLREIVFDPLYSDIRLARLNEITHKYVIAETERLIIEYDMAGRKGVIIDAPLLFESGLDKRCDVVISVVANSEVRIARIMLRDGISLESARRRIDSQIPDSVLIQKSDYVICNDGDLDHLYGEVLSVHNKIFEN